VELLPLVDVREVPSQLPSGGAEGTGTRGRGRGTGRGRGAGAGRGFRGRGGHGGQGDGGTGGQGGRGDQGGEGGEGEDARGGFVDTGDERSGPGGAFFPSVPGGEPIQQTCEPFLGERPLGELGERGERWRRLVQEIAHKLQIDVCDYPAHFCLTAAAVIGGRAQAVSEHAADSGGATRPSDGRANLGLLQFVPTASPSVQLLRHLAGVVSLVGSLARDVETYYLSGEGRGQLDGRWHDQPASWALRFAIELSDNARGSVGTLFVAACRALFLQLLRSSREQIDGRIRHFEIYAALFEQLVRSQLTAVSELIELRERLRRYQIGRQVQASLNQADQSIPGRLSMLGLVAPGSSWLDATRLVAEALAGSQRAPDRAAALPGQIVERNGVARILDGNRTPWAMDDLEREIVTRRGGAEEIDPIVKQIVDLPGLTQRLRADPATVRRELRALLTQMQQNNTEITGKAVSEWNYAFLASKIQESIPQATVPRTDVAMQGIHLLAHEQIGEFFAGDPLYAAGINSLFHAQLGREALTQFFTFTGLILLSVVCPPLGVAVGLAEAAYQVERAEERERIYGALIDPELVLTRAEVEADLFAARLGLALAFIPGVGKALGALRQGIRGAARAGVVAGVRMAGRYVARQISREIAEALARDLLAAFVREVITNVVMDRVIGAMLEPIIQQVYREALITGPVGGARGVQSTLAMLEREMTPARAERALHQAIGLSAAVRSRR
jgi:hypothetical protein